jgi:hypothetical protein
VTSSELSGERSGGERMSTNVFGLGLLECVHLTLVFYERGLHRLISGQGLYY